MEVNRVSLSGAGLLLVFIFSIFSLAGCQQKAVEPKPPDIAYGRDLCDRCGMIISEERFAAGLQLETGEYLKFDDTGEMIKYISSHPDLGILAWWVHDYESSEWIRGEEAYFVKSASLMTPMGTGIAVFQDKVKADRFASEHDGIIYNLDEIRTQVQMTNASH